MDVPPRVVREKWQASEAGRRYAGERWSSARHRERDPRRIGTLLARHLAETGERSGARLLDAPCGAGRLFPVLASHGRCVGLDVSSSMLAAARAASGERGALLRGELERLPFRDGSFDAVVCCRFLHHLSEREALARVLAELVRVSRGLVIASFWDAAALPAWRRALFPARRAPRRFTRSRAEIEAALDAAGASVVAWKHSLRFVSRQAFVVARKRPTEGTR